MSTRGRRRRLKRLRKKAREQSHAPIINKEVLAAVLSAMKGVDVGGGQ